MGAAAITAPTAGNIVDNSTLKTVTWPYTINTNGFLWIIIDVSVRTAAMPLDTQNTDGWPIAETWTQYTFPWRLNYFT